MIRLRLMIAASAIALLATGATAACTPIKFGYTNQEVPPYYLGNGALEATPPGASVELIRELAASFGCQMVSVRMPPLRIAGALESGQIDLAPLGLPTADSHGSAYPLDKANQPDRERSIRMYTVVFVRSSDKVARDVDSAHHLVGKKIGVNHGAPYAVSLRQAGFEVDDGALDVRRNLDKLMLGRIDAFAVSLTGAADMDTAIAARYGGDITRLDKPIRVANIWLVTSRAFYNANREMVEAMWDWIGQSGRARFSLLLKKYDKDQ
jgi:ABC-type amino acid transport substrate-binding protein